MARNQASPIEAVVVLLLATLCLGISFFLMAYGYRDFVPNPKWLLAGIIALIVVVALAYLNYRIRIARQRNENTSKIVIYFAFYLLVTAFSFFGNFNAIYPTFMGAELLRDELKEKRDAWEQLQLAAKSKLSSDESMRSKLDGLLNQLRSQISNREEPGCGPKCDKILREIEKLLNTTITRLRGGNKSELIRQYELIVEKEYEATLAANSGPKKEELIVQIDKDAEDLKPKINNAIANPTENNQGRETLKEVVEKYKEIGNKTQNLVGEKNFKYDAQIKVNNEEMGKISHTLNSALTNTGNWGTWIAAFLSLLFDLFVPVMIMVVTTPGTGDSRRYKYQPTEI